MRHYFFLRTLLLFVVIALVSCSPKSEPDSNSMQESLKGKWMVAGFRIGDGFDQLDSLQRLQLQFQLMQFQMLNIKYEFQDSQYKVLILNDSLYDEGNFKVRDSIITFHSTKLGISDSFRIVTLTNDTLEFTSATPPSPNQQIVTVNLVLKRHNDM